MLTIGLVGIPNKKIPHINTSTMIDIAPGDLSAGAKLSGMIETNDA